MFLKTIKSNMHKKHHHMENNNSKEVNEYLKDFNCDVCHNKCRLDQIKCPRGKDNQNKKIDEFNQKK